MCFSGGGCKKRVQLQESRGTAHSSNDLIGPLWSCPRTLYKACLKQALPQGVRPEAPGALNHPNKVQHKALEGLGIVDAQKKQVSIAAHRHLQLTKSLLAAACLFILWINNSNKHKYSRNPREVPDQSTNATPFQVLPIMDPMHAKLCGHPTHLTPIANVNVLRPKLPHAAGKVRYNVLTLLRSKFQFPHVCAPLHIRSGSVSMVPWHTFDITKDNVSLHNGLLRSWKVANEFH